MENISAETAIVFSSGFMEQKDLNEMAARLSSDRVRQNKPRLSLPVFKSASLQLVLMSLQNGAHIPEHKANGTLSVHVLEGEIRFTAGETSVELTKGQLLTLPENIPHQVLAKDDSVFLLSLALARQEANHEGIY